MTARGVATTLFIGAVSFVPARAADAVTPAIQRAVDWLAPVVADDAWQDQSLSAPNVGGRRIAVEAMLLFTLLAEPGLVTAEGLRERLERNVLAAANGDALATRVTFQDWAAGLTAFPLAEGLVESNDAAAVLRRLAAGVESRQNAEGAGGMEATCRSATAGSFSRSNPS